MTREPDDPAHRSAALVALVGNPNCGKSALFNRLTGSHQKVANYAGVTVERKEGTFLTTAGKLLRLLDLPGAYSLHPRTPDEAVTVKVLKGTAAGERRPDLVVCVVDATNLRRHLRLVLAVKRLRLPCVVALNMADVAQRAGLPLDPEALTAELGVPVVRTVAVEGQGAEGLRALLDDAAVWERGTRLGATPENDPRGDHEAVRDMLRRLGLARAVAHDASDRVDRIVLHPLLGPILLALLLFLVFQAVFAWAVAPMDAIEAGTRWTGHALEALLPDNWLRGLIVDGVIAGAGSVLVFLPQIVILFFFILMLEESGYLPRAAFLLDRLMGSVGLSGRSFIPLLSSFACAIPGIMAARTIANPRDRLVTILIIPLMACSARLPVYTLLIAAFIPRREVFGGIGLQGLVLFALYLAGVGIALLVAWLLKHYNARGQVRALMMELPVYHWPQARSILLGLWQRMKIFVHRVGGILLTLTVVLWFLASVPGPPPGAVGHPIEYSFAGMLGRALTHVFAPIGFNWQICVALVPGLAAREVAVSALGTVYALSSGGDTAKALEPLLAQSWTFATGISLLAWYVVAPMCVATLATIRRETGSRVKAAVAAGYLFGLAYLVSFIVYRLTLWLG